MTELNADCMLRIDEVIKWEVKDVCFWLQAVSFTEIF